MGAVGFQESDWIWKNGEMIGWHDAQLHLLSTAVQFGTSVFEGIRAYETPKGPAIFKLDQHLRRLMDSAKVYRMTPEDYGLRSSRRRSSKSCDGTSWIPAISAP